MASSRGFCENFRILGERCLMYSLAAGGGDGGALRG